MPARMTALSIYSRLDLDFHPLRRWNRWRAGRGCACIDEGKGNARFAMRANWPRDLTLRKRFGQLSAVSPRFSDFIPIVRLTLCAAETAHRIFTRLSVLVRIAMHSSCCSACRNRRYTIARRCCLNRWLSFALSTLSHILLKYHMCLAIDGNSEWIGSPDELD